jgi:maltose O-acetyltransferase
MSQRSREAPPTPVWRGVVNAVAEELRGVDPRLTMVEALCRLLPPFALGRLRRELLRLAGVRIGPRTVFVGSIWIAGGSNPARDVTFGADCMVNDGCRFDTAAPIAVGDNVYLGHDVALITATHDVGTAHRRAHRFVARSITVGDGTWIGARAVLMPGVTVGRGAIVAAGAVVTKPVADGAVVGGVPARVIRHLD